MVRVKPSTMCLDPGSLPLMAATRRASTVSCFISFDLGAIGSLRWLRNRKKPDDWPKVPQLIPGSVTPTLGSLHDVSG